MSYTFITDRKKLSKICEEKLLLLLDGVEKNEKIKTKFKEALETDSLELQNASGKILKKIEL